MVYHGMKQTFGRTPSWQTPFVDFAAWARSMGVPSLAIESPDQLNRGLVSKFLQSRGPSVLDLRIDRDVRIRGAGRVEALQQMQLVESKR
jgi:acetolactate synthase-1/2/3 large subunit